MNLTLPVRWMREIGDSGEVGREDKLKHGEGRWTIPAEQTALVLVDCWADYNVLQSNAERCAKICRERILPTMRACRKAGVTIMHAPSESWAANYPQWLACAGDDELFGPPPGPEPSWPPKEFRRREGPYAPFRAPWLADEPAYQEWLKSCPPEQRRIFDFLGPAPGDFMVGTGEQLHRLCHHRKILHLLYAGFAANICMQFRPYGTREMRHRGYNIILLRDCTTAIETPETLAGLWMTETAILNIEMKVGASTTSADMQRACREASP